ncbi:hypothetical protein GOARA_088_00140 [Gordonia araii NBRC 100433]|uniref:DUF3349 domain-containing protein n=1 Tax=Gordonia araii NBRC 100433 TaxID=1073574 RepID=G7H7C6_9ACTN|nr:DUF3349 domain-containing protein [Gordonia araii]NNG98434.1 DUF3349 domain-containing protein [Gordonia araii NBRC 100433]GAB11751.1 hypothetical protein GOARA_088_00140 [Gordonia araii NBRC 100433]
MTPFDSIVGWIRGGYPEGVDRSDFPPLLALLTRVLDEQEVTRVAQTLADEAGVPTVTEQQIHDAIARVTEQAPTPEEINQVAARLAAAGWPLAVTLPDT